jgi:hypothetical protein
MLTIRPTDQDLFAAIELFIGQILPAGNAMFTGSTQGFDLNVRAMVEGTIEIGEQLLGDGTAPNTFIESQVSGDPGGAGMYKLSVDQGIANQPGTLTTGFEVIQAQVNRVPEPRVADFVLMTIVSFPRLGTNFEAYADATFLGSIDGTVLTVESVTHGTIGVGSPLYGVDVLPNTYIRAPGAVDGQWIIGPVQAVTSRALAAGLKTIMQPSQCVIQLDFHGPNGANMSKIFTTIFRSENGVDMFAALNPNIAPLYCADPRQMPFRDGEQQYENRYIVEANFQVNQTVSIGQQYAQALEITTLSIDVQPIPVPGGNSLDFSNPDNSQYIPGL